MAKNSKPQAPWKPTKAQLLAADGTTVRDIIGPGMNVVFCGINPGLYSGATGHHFARPGNRFWPALYASGFTPRLLSPFENYEMPKFKLGITNLVRRATNTAAELSDDELRAGRKALEKLLLRYRPKILAVLGLTSYRTAFDRPKAVIGLQPETIGPTRIWLLPNPSGLNAHHTPVRLKELFLDLKRFSDAIRVSKQAPSRRIQSA